MLHPLQWFFGSGGSEHQGPNDSIITTFRGNKYYSLAREVIQNSLDAAEPNSNKPVKVSFVSENISISAIPRFEELKDSFEQCRRFYGEDSRFHQFCTSALSILEKDSITCLRISDYNTVGMAYQSEDEKSPFYAFMKSVGYNLKSSSGSGGSFGYGKGAYYAASQLRTIFVSSVYGDKNHIFQGKARLTTHRDGEGKIKDYSGFYGREDGRPVIRPEDIPEVFRRTAKGTDILIPGFHEEQDWKDSLIKSVLNNFWLSILEKHLVVKVEDTVIEEKNLEQIVSQYYTETTSDGTVHDPENWNPYPYLKAVKYNQGGPSAYFQELLPVLGLTRIYFLVKDGYPNRTVYLRSPKMTVFKKTDNRGFNYAAVFVCDNAEGNRILRQMENPQHNEWKKDNYTDNDVINRDARKAEEEIKRFVKRCLEKVLVVMPENSQRITGLENYLAIPEDLLPDQEGNAEATVGGQATKTLTDTETGAETTRRTEISSVTLAVKKPVQVAAYTEGQPDTEGQSTVLTGAYGAPNETGGDGNKEPVEGGAAVGETRGPAGEAATTPVKIPFSIKYRVIAQVSSAGDIQHVLKINSSKDTKADIELYAGLDNENDSTDNILPIVAAEHGLQALIVRDNKIKAIQLVAGWNLVTVRFDSNQKHALKLRSYEV